MSVPNMSVASVPNLSLTPPPGAKDMLLWLKTEGEKFVDEKGKTFILRGINLGGFLVEEMWMMPFNTTPPAGSLLQPIRDHASLWSVMEKRFGKNDSYEICKALRQAWLTDADFVKIREAGFNSVRLPFLHDSMEEPEGLFPWIDWTIEKASKQGLYVILDLHGAPGRQSDEDHTGKEKSCRLFWEYHFVQKTCDLWGKIADRYKDRPEVAGYDILNEPMGAQTSAALSVIQGKIYDAIRRVDKKHIIFMEDGYKGLERQPSPEYLGWENVSLSVHAYAKSEKTEELCLQKFQEYIAKYATEKNRLKAPIYVGEFNVVHAGTPTTVHKVISLLEESGISWSLWTYKVVTSVPSTNWGLYRADKADVKINPYTLEKRDILEKIKNLATDHFQPHKELLEVLQLSACGVKPALPQPAAKDKEAQK